MKRSEAVKKIVEIVNHHDGGSIEPYVADRLLEVLVDGFGMLPPVQKHKLPLAYNRFVEHCTWEPEDEA